MRALIFIILILTSIGCNKDDFDYDLLIGDWEIAQIDGLHQIIDGCNVESYDIFEGGTLIYLITNNCNGFISDGTWSVSGDILTISTNEEIRFNVIDLTSIKMTTTHKVDDNKIEMIWVKS